MKKIIVVVALLTGLNGVMYAMFCGRTTEYKFINGTPYKVDFHIDHRAGCGQSGSPKASPFSLEANAGVRAGGGAPTYTHRTEGIVRSVKAWVYESPSKKIAAEAWGDGEKGIIHVDFAVIGSKEPYRIVEVPRSKKGALPELPVPVEPTGSSTSTEQPMVKPAVEPATSATTKPASQPSQKPGQKAAQKPARKPAQRTSTAKGLTTKQPSKQAQKPAKK